MDLQTSLLCLGLVIISGSLIFFISTFGTRSQSYEEVKAANRKMVAQIGLLDDPEKQKRLLQQQTKKNKKASKKVKEKQAKEANNADATNSGSAQSDNETEPASSGAKPRRDRPSPDSAKTRRDQPSPVAAEPAEAVVVKQEEPSKTNKDKTDVSTKVSKEVKTAKNTKAAKPEKEKSPKAPQPEVITPAEPPKEQRKAKNKNNSPLAAEKPASTDKKEIQPPAPIVPEPVEIIVKPETITETSAKQSAPLTQVKTKKKKNELAQYQQLITCPEGVNVNLLVQLLDEVPMSRSEIQILTDCLLNKQNGPLPEHSEWSEGPKDPVQKMKKQLAEKEKALAADQEAMQGMQVKLKELRTSLNTERTRCTQISQTSEETTNELRAEMTRMQTRIQRGIDENLTLRQQVNQLQGKIATEGDFTAQRTQMELHIQSLSEKNVTLTGNFTSIQNENAELREAHAGSSNQLHEAIDRIRFLENIVEENEMRLSDNLKGLSEAQAEVQRLNTTHANTIQQTLLNEKQHEELDRYNRQLLADLNSAKAEKDHLNEMVKELVEKLAAQPTPNGTTIVEKDDTINIEKAVAAVRVELEKSHNQQMDVLQSELDQYKDKNNDLRTKNWKIMEALTAAETKLKKCDTQATDDNSIKEAMLKNCADEQNKNKAVLQRLFPQITVESDVYQDWLDKFAEKAKQYVSTLDSNSTLYESGKKKITELETTNANLQKSLDQYKKIIVTKDEDLSRIKNDATEVDKKWQNQFADKLKEFEEVQKKSVNKEVLVEKYLDEQNQSKEILQRLFPNAPATGNSYKEWVNSFAEKVSENLSETNKTIESNEDNNQRINELDKENRKLQTAVEHYKKIIEDMDNTLSRIQDGATEMDKKWEICVATKQKELDESKQHADRVEKEIQTLKQDYENQCKKLIDIESSENNSFSKNNKSIGGMAEFEKLSQENSNLRETIERLQSASLALNGPMQLPTITSFDRKASKKRRSIAGWLRRKITFRRKKSKEMRTVDKKNSRPREEADGCDLEGYRENGPNTQSLNSLFLGTKTL